MDYICLCLQRMDLRMDGIGEHSRTLPGLKLSNPYNKLWSVKQDDAALPVSVPPLCDRQPSAHLPIYTESHSANHDSSSLATDSLELSTPNNITIPRPHGRKTPELGTVLAPPVAGSRSKPAGTGEGRTTTGGQEFRQALSMTTDGDLLKPTKVAEDSIDLLSLLDPLKTSAQISSKSLTDGRDTGMSSSCKPVLPPMSYPQALPPFTVHPHVSLNPFAQSLQHTSPQMHYSPTVSGNPFSAVYGHPAASYLHTPPQPQPFSALAGLYRQPSPGSTALTTTVTLVPHSSASSYTLSSLADSMSGPGTATNTLEKPHFADREKTRDPFGDLLTMVKPATPQKKKVEDLRRRWETFD